MADYTRKEFKFSSRGINVTKPPDILDEDQYPLLINVRALQQGVLQSRPGFSKVNTNAIADLNIHSVIRLNNDLASASQAFARFLGASTKLHSDDAAHTTFTQRASGFSGNPLQFVVMRPAESPEPWLYIGDGSKSGKARVDGTFYGQGIAPPVVPPYAQPAATSYAVINAFEAIGAWTNGGTAGAITLVTRITTTISKIVYDTGTTGWATVQPATLDSTVQVGMLLIVNSGGGTQETILVEAISEAVTNTTISSIQYDTGSTGACTIQLAAPTDRLARDSMLRIDSGGGGDEVVRVLGVMQGPGLLPSFRCSTVNTQSAGKSITGVRSFRAYFANNHVATEGLIAHNLESTITVGTGYLTLVGALDLSVVSSRPIRDDDEIHISLKLDVIDNLTEGKVELDVDSTTNDFTRNYYYKNFRANDLSPATTGSITTLAAKQRILQRRQIDRQLRRSMLQLETGGGFAGEGRILDTGLEDENALDNLDPTTQTTLGTSQWTELRFKVKDLIRVGADTSRTLHDVAAIRVQLQTGGSVLLDVGAWWIGGTYGADNLPDVGIGADYNYRYVYRSKLTGAQSNPSPPMRSGIEVRRQRVTGTVTASADAQVDQIDIYRTGGALITVDGSPPWFYVMSVANSSPSFTDDFPDDMVIRNRQLDFDNFQPFLDLDVPRSGTCNTVGTEVTRTGGTDTFNTAWPAGTIITINNVKYTLYAQPSTTTNLSLNENAGTQTGVNWFVTAPRLQAQTLPGMWGPFGGGIFAPVVFACGSSNRPGHLFWTQPGNPDANGQFGSLELTSPSEPLMNGCIYHSQAFVFSSEALYVLAPTIVGSELRFSGARVAGNRGLFSRYGICVGDEGIFYLSRDGIYLTTGAQSVSLTDEMLYPLFPHEGVAGATTNTIVPPDFTQPQNLLLSYGESMLYFDFVDTGGNRATLVFDIKLKGWFYYNYTPGIIRHYFEEGRGLNTLLLGGNNGRLYLSGGALDDAAAIACTIWTPWFDAGEPRASKLFGDAILDFNSGVSTIQVVVRADNNSATLGTISAQNPSRLIAILDYTQGLHKNLYLQITGNTASANPLLFYGYDFSVVAKPEESLLRALDWVTFDNTKYVRGVIIEADTASLGKSVQIQSDGGVIQQTLTISHVIQMSKPYALIPFPAHNVRAVPTDNIAWRFFRVTEWIVDDYPELAAIDTGWTNQATYGS